MFFGKRSEDFHKERKSTKKKEKFGRGGLWKLPQPRKSDNDAFGDIFLMISTAPWKSLRGGPLRLSHSYAQARRRLILSTHFSMAAIHLKIGDFLSQRWGVPQNWAQNFRIGGFICEIAR
jgi:hypothetical protein